MLKKILIANRGEIAVRIIRACKEMNIKTVAIYSTADKNSLHRVLADEAYCVGSPKAVDSYLNMSNVLSIAHLSGCDAIHPGYGFLSENATFARLVERCGLIFIGPNPDIIESMGNKATARETMKKAGVNVIPGSPILKNIASAKEQANKIGYPVLIKASNGGGGKGMRVASSEEQIEEAFQIAKAEALANFGSEEVYIEKLIEHPKHIEVQILGDKHGNVVHLFERDCSIQRNRQKLIEEAPSTNVSPEVLNQIYEAAIKAAKYVKYDSVGTVEFLVKGNDFYFMEMNTRIQVEHPITEMITNVDLVKSQIKVAENKVLNFKQSDLKISGHSIECRINAEDVYEHFKPSCGKVTTLYLPGGKGVRIDSAIFSDCEISPFYDSMLLKLIVFGHSRIECLKKLRVALEEIIIEGVKTNVDFHYSSLYSEYFINGNYDIEFVEKMSKEYSKNDELVSE